MKYNNQLCKFCAGFSATLFLALCPEIVFAVNQNLGDVAQNITENMKPVAHLIESISYVAGVCFAIMGMLKLKAHKDNPVQVPMSQAFVLLAISAGLMFLPSLINTTGSTIWKDGVHAQADGSGLDFVFNTNS